MRNPQQHPVLHQAEELTDYDGEGFVEVPGTDGGLLKKILTEGSGDETPIKVAFHLTRSNAQISSAPSLCSCSWMVVHASHSGISH